MKISSRLLLTLLFCLSLLSLSYNPGLAEEGSWTLLPGPLAPGGWVTSLTGVPGKPGFLFGLFNNDTNDPSRQMSLISNLNAEGIWKTVNPALPVTPAQPVTPGRPGEFQLAFEPGSQSILYVSGQEGLWVSENAGESFHKIHDSNVFAAAGNGRVYVATVRSKTNEACQFLVAYVARSDDRGAHWTEHFAGCLGDRVTLAASPLQPDVVYVSGIPPEEPDLPAKVLRSGDGGLTWIRLPSPDQCGPLPDDPCQGLAELFIDPQNTDRLVGIDWSTSELWVSQDQGQHWNKINGFDALAVARSGDSLLAAGFVYNPADYSKTFRVYRSLDEGVTWWAAPSTLPEAITSIVAGEGLPDGRVYATSGSYGVYRSEDYGATWQEMDDGLRTRAQISRTAITPASPSQLLVASDYPRPATYLSLDGGFTWSDPLPVEFQQPLDPGAQFNTLVVSPKDPRVAWGAAENRIYFLDRATLVWNLWANLPVDNPILDIDMSWQNPNLMCAVINEISLEPKDLSILLCTRRDQVPGTGYYQKIMIPGAISIDTVAFDPSNDRRLLVAGTFWATEMGGAHAMGMALSEDDGQTWNTVFRKSILYFSEQLNLAFSPFDPYLVVLDSFDSGFYLSQDGGKTWQDQSSADHRYGNRGNPKTVFDSKGSLYRIEPGGLYRRTLTGVQWTQVRFNFSGQQPLNDLALLPGHPEIFYVSAKDGLYRGAPPPWQTWLPVIGK